MTDVGFDIYHTVPNEPERGRFASWRTKRAEKKAAKPSLLSRLQLLLYKLIFAHLGKFIIAGFYFLALELLKGQHTTLLSHPITLPDVKGTWDHLLSRAPHQGGVIRLMNQDSWDGMRHVVFRGLIEGVLGVVLFNQIGFKVDKYRAKLEQEGGPGKFDRLILRSKVFASPYQDCPVTPLQYLFLPIMLLLITTVVGAPVYLLVNHFAHVLSIHWLTSPGVQHNFAQKLYTGSEVYEGLIVGLVVGFAASRSYRAYLYANAMNGGRAWVAKGGKPHWWMPWPTRNLIRDLCKEGVQRQRDKLAERHEAVKIVVPVLSLIALGFGVLGYLVISTSGFTH